MGRRGTCGRASAAPLVPPPQARVAGDSLVYGDIAKNLLRHHIYGFSEVDDAGHPQIRPTLIRLPGYPLFLAACFRLFGMEHYGSALYLQIAADLLTCWLAAALAGRLFGPRAFLPVLWLAALCPFTASYTATPLTETLVLTTIALAFYAFARWQQAGSGYNSWLWTVAAALGYSILLRPEQGLLAAAIIPAMLWAALASRRRLRLVANRPSRARSILSAASTVLVAAVCVLLPLVPWAMRNWQTFRVFQPLAPRSATDPGEPHVDGFNRWYRTWAIEFASTEDVYWNYDGNRIELPDLPARAFAQGCLAPAGVEPESLPLFPATSALINDYDVETAAKPAFDARFDALASRRIHAAPACYYLAMPVARLIDMALRPRTEMMPIPVDWWKPTTPARQRSFASAYAALNFIYFALALAGFRAAWQQTAGGPAARCVLGGMAASIVLRCALLLTLDNSEPRYTLEFFPVVFVCLGALFLPSHAERTT